MDIYIVLIENHESHFNELEHSSFEERHAAKNFAVSMANSSTNSLESIFKINTTSMVITEYELTLVNGRFELKEV